MQCTVECSVECSVQCTVHCGQCSSQCSSQCSVQLLHRTVYSAVHSVHYRAQCGVHCGALSCADVETVDPFTRTHTLASLMTMRLLDALEGKRPDATSVWKVIPYAQACMVVCCVLHGASLHRCMLHVAGVSHVACMLYVACVLHVC